MLLPFGQVGTIPDICVMTKARRAANFADPIPRIMVPAENWCQYLDVKDWLNREILSASALNQC
jgi:hypothetical protein